MADLTLVSYDLNGKKLSFANWISNLSPEETPFVSMTGKESINQTLFQWQTDSLEQAANDNAVVEGSAAEAPLRSSTTVLNNYTQILRKVVRVSDTANALANYGRGQELQYQLEKAGKEIKRDLEVIFLSDQEKEIGNATTIPRRTSGFQDLVADFEVPDPDTSAVVKFAMAGEVPTEDEIFQMTYNLYISGSCADVIMFHPKFADFFSSLTEISQAGNRVKMFSGQDTKYSKYVTEIIDPLGCSYKLIPNRWMPETAIYFFDAKCWTQMVLRAPERTKLAKDGSYEKWMIELEVGLRHKHPYASGVLLTDSARPATPVTGITVTPATSNVNIGATRSLTATVAPADATNKAVTWSTSNASVATVNASGVATGVAPGSVTITATTTDGGFTGSTALTVNPIAVTGVTLSPASASLSLAGTNTQVYTTVVSPTNATNKAVTYTLSPTGVAAYNPTTNTLTGMAPGTTTLTVTTTDGGFTATSSVTVAS